MAGDNNNSHSSGQKGNNNGKKGRFNSKNDRNTSKKPISSKEKFKGKCKDLEGVIFDANRFNQADEYIKAVNEIAEYVGSNYENGADIRQSV